MPPTASVELREAISPHETPTSEASWDGDEQEAEIPNDVGEDVLEGFYAARNEDEDPDTKSAYSFIHHFYDDGMGDASTTAASTGIGILNGGRGVDPAEQWWSDIREGIHEHLAAHLEDAGVDEPPELQSLEEASARAAQVRTERRGQNLASTLNRLYERILSDDQNEIETLNELDGVLGQEAGVADSTVQNIRLPEDDPSIDCPPIERLEGFARALSSFLPSTVSELQERLVSQAESDGCEYDMEEEDESASAPGVHAPPEEHPVRAAYDERRDGDPEERTYTNLRTETRQDEDGEATIQGHAAVFDEETEIGGMFGNFREVIKPGAFDRVIQENMDTRYLINHDPDKLMGRVAAGTLELEQTDRGLRYRNDPPDTTYASDLMESIRRGDMDQSSFQFRVTEEKWIESDAEDEPPLREIHEVWPMRDVASVTFPAYDGTDVSLRSELRSVENRVGVDLERLARILALQAGGQLDRDRAREGLEIIDTVRRRLEDRSGRLELMERELQLCKRRNRV